MANQDGAEAVVIHRLSAWKSLDGYTRLPGISISMQPGSQCVLGLSPGVHEIVVGSGPATFVLVPQRVWLHARVTQEILRHPNSAPPATSMPDHIARAMSDILEHGLSWALATRILGLGPRGEFHWPEDSE